MQERHTTLRTEPVTTLCEPDDHVPPMEVTLLFVGLNCARAGIDARARRARQLTNIGEPRVLMKGEEERFSSHSRGNGKRVVLRG